MALTYSAEMSKLVNNAGGAVQDLPQVSLAGGRVRAFIATITLATQAAASQIAIARLPKGAVPIGFIALPSTSLGSATMAIGDVHSGNSARFLAAQTLTAGAFLVGATGVMHVPLTTVYDLNDVQGQYEELIITTAAASLPASGTLTVVTLYTID